MKKVILFSFFLMAILFLYSWTVEPKWISIEKTEIANPKIPESFDGKKIVFFSDLHYGRYVSIKQIQTVVNKINSLGPDIVLFGGDLFYQPSGDRDQFFKTLDSIQAPLGKYWVTGNHDNSKTDNISKYEQNNFSFQNITNQATKISIQKDGIILGGVGDFETDSQDLKPMLNENLTNYSILLSHNPDFFPRAAYKHIDLTLSGHTHGGQVTLFGLWAPLIPSQYGQHFRSGLIKEQSETLIVSKGIGTSIMPFRFFACPDIWEITLKHK